jgi:N-acyl homoserine lactone hydrolase
MRIASRPKNMRFYAFNAGKINAPDRGMLAAGRGGQPVTLFVAVYLIQHPRGNLLVDTGMNPVTWPLPQKDEVVFRPEQRIDKQLAKLGLDPEDIKYVIMTHLHMDHAGWMTLFPKSTFIVRKAELRHAWWPDKWVSNNLAFGDYKDTRDYNYVQLDDIEDFDIFLDGTIICIDTKGHTPGHQSVMVDLPESGKIIFAGDAVSLSESLDESIMPGIVWDPDLAQKTIAKLQHMQRNGVRIFLGHDPDFFKTVKLAPKYYD